MRNSGCATSIEQLLRDKYDSCTACELHLNAKQKVYCRGSYLAKIVLLGEAPGRTENEVGKAFVGSSGNLLSKGLSKLGWTEADFIILNAVLCWPPENRDPSNAEIDACRPRLHHQLQIISPDVVVCMGKKALAAVRPLFANESVIKMATESMNPDSIIASWRPDWLHRTLRMFVTLHPSAMLRRPAWKQIATEHWREIHKYCTQMNLIRSKE